MPTTLPQAAIKFRFENFNEVREREPSFIGIVLGVALTIIIPPMLLLFASAAIAGHGEVSLRSIGAAFEAAGRAELCVDTHDCGSNTPSEK